MTDKLTRSQLGILAEDIAARYLQQQGLDIVKRNFRTRLGEIDLIMLHDKVLVFVEVRFRSSPFYMDAIETINKPKVQRIILAARQYLQGQTVQSNTYRFDIVTLIGNIEQPDVNWIQNAFYEN